MSTALINLKQLGYHYPGGDWIVKEVTFGLYPRQRVAIVGDNGSGKTTLLHLMLGLLPATQGAIEILGQRRRTEAEFAAIRTHIGLVFQAADDQVFCPTVLEDVAFGPLNQGYTMAQAHTISCQVLTQLGLQGYEHRLTHQLSGGEKRLVALAGVLAMQPQALLLDEPTTGLDQQAKQRLLTQLQQLPQALLIVSHDEAFLAQLALQCYELRDGSLQPMTQGH